MASRDARASPLSAGTRQLAGPRAAGQSCEAAEEQLALAAKERLVVPSKRRLGTDNGQRGQPLSGFEGQQDLHSQERDRSHPLA